MSDEYISIEEKISKNISKKIGSQLQLTELDTAKMEYGLSILLVDFFKLFFIYSVALILHIGLDVLVTHLAFIMLRRTTKSYHASNSTVCTILSIFFLVLLPFLASFYEIAFNRIFFVLATLTICLIVSFKKTAIAQKPVKLFKNEKIHMICTSLFLTVVGLILPNNHIRTLIFLGMAISTFFMFIKKRKWEEK